MRCLGRLTALAPRAEVADEFVANPAEHFAPGQSVLARVKEVRHDTQRVVLSLKVSVLLFTVTFYANLAHSLTRSP